MSSSGGGSVAGSVTATLSSAWWMLLARKRIAAGVCFLLLAVYLFFVSSRGASTGDIPQSKLVDAIKFTANNVKALQEDLRLLREEVGTKGEEQGGGGAALTSLEGRVIAIEKASVEATGQLSSLTTDLGVAQSMLRDLSSKVKSAAASGRAGGDAPPPPGVDPDELAAVVARLEVVETRLKAKTEARAPADGEGAGASAAAALAAATAAQTAAEEAAARIIDLSAADLDLRKELKTMKDALIAVRVLLKSAQEETVSLRGEMETQLALVTAQVEAAGKGAKASAEFKAAMPSSPAKAAVRAPPTL